MLGERPPAPAHSGRSSAIHLIAPDVFSRHGGIARISRALAAALGEYAAAHGLRLFIHALHDRRGDMDTRYIGNSVSVVGYESHRVHFAAAVARAARERSTRLLFYSHLNFAPLSAVGGAPYAVLCHGIEAWDPLPLHRRFALQQADRVVCVSDFTARIVAATQGVAPDRLVTLWNCLDPLWTGHEPSSSPVSGPFVLVVSRLGAAEEQKGVGDALRGYAEAVRVHGLNPAWRLVVVGDGPARRGFEALASELGVAGRTQFLGGVGDNELRALYRDCEVFLLPSAKEGFGLVFLEAMAFSRPVIGACAAAVPEVVLDGTTGLLVPFGDPQAIGHAIVRLARHPELRRVLGSAGRRHLEANFTYSRYASRTAAVLDELSIK